MPKKGIDLTGTVHDRLILLFDELRDKYGKNENFAKKLGFNPSNVSRYRSGVSGGKVERISTDRLRIIANFCNVRYEWLMGIDDYRTEDEMEKSLIDLEFDKYKKIVDYLSTIGLIIKPVIYWTCNKKSMYYGYWEMEKHITESSKNYIRSIINIPTQEKTQNYNNVKFKEQGQLYDDDDRLFFIELKDDPPTKRLVNIYKLAKRRQAETLSGYNSIDFFREKLYEVRYKIEYQGKVIGTVDINYMQNFFDHLESLCQVSIETILLNGTLTSVIPCPS